MRIISQAQKRTHTPATREAVVAVRCSHVLRCIRKSSEVTQRRRCRRRKLPMTKRSRLYTSLTRFNSTQRWLLYVYVCAFDILLWVDFPLIMRECVWSSKAPAPACWSRRHYSALWYMMTMTKLLAARVYHINNSRNSSAAQTIFAATRLLRMRDQQR